MMNNNSLNIPYFEVNKEYLEALNKVIWTANELKNKITSEVTDLRGTMKGKNEQISKLEHEIQNLKELNANSLFLQYTTVVEENAKLTKDWNMQLHRYEELKL